MLCYLSPQRSGACLADLEGATEGMMQIFDYK
jgi:hypothetical protein